MDQQGLCGEIDGCSCPGDVTVVGESLLFTAGAHCTPSFCQQEQNGAFP
jgi:hypothetical protein